MAARRLLVSVGVASVLAGAMVGSGVAEDAGSAPCAGTPTLRLADADPVTFEGAGFCAGERVRIRARAGDTRRAHRRRADADGSFRVRFRGIDYDPCAGTLRASAWSAGELRARFKLPPKLCPVPLMPGGGPHDPGPDAPGPGHDRCDARAPASGKPGPQPLCPPD